MNDAACDPQGRFWAGSMAYDQAPGAGSLHRLDADGSLHTVLRGLTISNGLGWSPDSSVLYLNDSGPSVTWAFDVDPETGRLSSRRPLVEHRTGACDGLTMDDEGCLWIALWGGSAVERFDDTGQLVERVTLPAQQPSDCCLVDGRLYAVDVGVYGPPVVPFAGARPRT